MMKTVMIVSLSAGLLGEDFVSHEVDIGVRRLEEYGLTIKYATHAKMGMEYLKDHPEDRAADLLEALRDPDVDLIMTDIGGSDTYRLLPYLFDHDELRSAACDKAFLGFSDTSVNHLMLHKVGMKTFYGQAFLPDVCELGREMLPYTKRYFEELLETGTIREITPSDVWYESRPDFGENRVGTDAVSHPDPGWELLQGAPTFSGKVLGGCIDTLSDLLDGNWNVEAPAVVARYGLFPALDDWRGKILLLESSEVQPPPEKYRSMLQTLKDYGLFGVVSGVLIGKPMDNKFADEYKEILVDLIDDPDLPVLFGLHVGHGTPRCIIPFGVDAAVDATEQRITFES